MISLKAYTDWINKAPKNARLTYYRGYLCDPYLQPISPTIDRERVKKLGKVAYDSYNANLVNLVQKKHADFDYEYIAVRK